MCYYCNDEFERYAKRNIYYDMRTPILLMFHCVRYPLDIIFFALKKMRSYSTLVYLHIYTRKTFELRVILKINILINFN